jgi:hypothetical protein
MLLPVDEEVNAVVKHVEDLAQLNGGEQPRLGYLIVVFHDAEFVEEQTPGDKVRKIEYGIA